MQAFSLGKEAPKELVNIDHVKTLGGDVLLMSS